MSHTALAVRDKDTALSPVVELGTLSASTGAGLLEAAASLATPLKQLIDSRGLASNISGRPYVKCEGWTAMAAMLGITPHEVAVEENDGIYTAVVELRRLKDGQAIARASAECGSPDELDRHGKPMWASRPRYARRSMALTRATAKACRLAFSWIIVLAGYEATPAEEMPRDARTEDDDWTEVDASAPAQEAPAPAPAAPAPPKQEVLPPASDLMWVRQVRREPKVDKNNKEYYLYKVYFRDRFPGTDKDLASTFDVKAAEVAQESIILKRPVRCVLLQAGQYWNLEKVVLA